MRNAIRLKGENLTPQKKFTPIFNSEPEAAREFCAVILPFSTGEVALAAGRSKDTVKCWKAARAFPNGVSLMNLAMTNRTVRGWVLAKLNVREMPEFVDDRLLTVMMAMLNQGLYQSGPDGDAVRAEFARLNHP